MSTVLEVRDAQVAFPVTGGEIRALDGVSLRVGKGETVAVVGESGCGKTTLAKAILGLQPLTGGEIVLGGERVEGIHREQARRVGMVWQDPFASLNPRWPVARSVQEPLQISGQHRDVVKLFEQVGLEPRFMDRFPHQLSGGQRQRVAIARALALHPPLILCDEPTAALDLSVRAQVLNQLKHIQRQEGCSYLYISHDLATVRFLADRVAVMYLGRIVEEGPADEVFAQPRHPYTAALLESAPTLERLMHLPEPLPGEIPDPREVGTGCRFAGRCPRVLDRCRKEDPGRSEFGNVAIFCHNPQKTSSETGSPAS